MHLTVVILLFAGWVIAAALAVLIERKHRKTKLDQRSRALEHYVQSRKVTTWNS